MTAAAETGLDSRRMSAARLREATARADRDGARGPKLSVILATDGVEQGRETLAHLSRQTAADRIEVLLVTPPGSVDGGADPDLDGFHSVRVIEADPRSSTARARATAVPAARAPVVAMTESHCFPEPGWAEALIAAHRGPWAAVGPEFDNENPGTASWANLFVDYSTWITPLTPGQADDLPGNNSSYKRSLLLEYGEDLARWLESESILHWDLRSRGHGLYIEPGARVRHLNIDRLIPALAEHFLGGRCFAGLRSRGWHPLRRALYVIASPLIPVIRLRRMFQHLRRTSRRDLLPGVLPMMVGSLIAHATGEMMGYLAGTGSATSRLAKYELVKQRYVARAGGTSAGGRTTEAVTEA